MWCPRLSSATTGAVRARGALAGSARVDLLVLCGGLGPTDDDVTRDVVAEVFERPQAEDPGIVEHLRARYAARGYAARCREINLRQAMVPRGAACSPNPHGSAPGLWLEAGARVVLLLPGPPRELKPMFAALVEEPLRPRSDGAGVSPVGPQDDGADRVADGRAAAAALSATGPRGRRRWRRRSWPPLGRSNCTSPFAMSRRRRRDAAAGRGHRAGRRCRSGTTCSAVDGESLEAVVGALLAERVSPSPRPSPAPVAC